MIVYGQTITTIYFFNKMLTLKAPAKINWFLHVHGKRTDGFHQIESLIQKITLYDLLRFSIGDELVLNTDCQVPLEENLVYRAARLIMDRYEIRKGAVIELQKNIPAGAGLGGGSSDAASALLGLNKLWSLDLPDNELSALASQLGSDVPFFLYNPLCYVSGRGEKITPCKAEKRVNILLVKPEFSISTPWAYKEYSNLISSEDSGWNKTRFNGDEIHDMKLTKKAGKVNNIGHFVRFFERAELSEVAGVVSNDIELAAIKSFPEIAEIKKRLIDCGADFALMSGSGSSVFGVFDTEEQAEEASRAFGDLWTAVVQTIID